MHSEHIEIANTLEYLAWTSHAKRDYPKTIIQNKPKLYYFKIHIYIIFYLTKVILIKPNLLLTF